MEIRRITGHKSGQDFSDSHIDGCATGGSGGGSAAPAGNRKHLGVAALSASMLAAVLALGVHPVTADNAPSADGEHKGTVEMRGKPPYKRTRTTEQADTVDLASLEMVGGGDVADVTVWEREASGRPPFARMKGDVQIVDTASMELSGQPQRSTGFRGKPPFKRH